MFLQFYKDYSIYISHKSNYKANEQDYVQQFQLSWNPSEGTSKLVRFSFNDNNIDDNNINNTLIYKCNFGGVISFLKSSNNDLDNNATFVCMNHVIIQKYNIKLTKNNLIISEDSYVLPENLFKVLKSINNAKSNWEYLLKSKCQEFLIVDRNGHQQIQDIEIYNINTSQLVNVFYRHDREENFLISNNNEPGIFAISTDSSLFAYSYGNNIITIYLMESGLEVVTKKFDNIYKIKFLEFIEKDKKLFIIEKDKKDDVKFHLWIISGCLNDYFSISGDDAGLSSNNISTLLKYDEYRNTLAKANGQIVFLEKVNEKPFKVVSEINVNRTIIGENEAVTDKYVYNSCDLEPWNNDTNAARGRFLNNDKSLLLIYGQNSIQLWKSKSINFVDFEDFNNFENSNLVYIFICDKIKSEIVPKFQIDDDMTTVIIHACRSLVYLYKHAKSTNSKEKHQKFINGTINIIKDFIEKYPDNWKLMEVQHPLMAYLIYSRSFSLIKHILFGTTGMLHRPQKKNISYLYFNDLELCDDSKLKDEILKAEDGYLKSEDGYLKSDDGYPKSDDGYPKSDDGYPRSDDGYLKSEDGYLETEDGYLETEDGYLGTENNDLKTDDKGLKAKNEDLKAEYEAINDLTLALKFCEGQDAVMLAYLLEYYSENSMNHFGWMINVTKILPKLPADYVELLYYKPCFGGTKHNFPIKRFKELLVNQDQLNLKVYIPLTRLVSTRSLTFLEYKSIRDDEISNIYMVPLPDFTTNIKEKGFEKISKIFNLLRKHVFPPGYKKLDNKDLSPFLQINNTGDRFFDVPVIEAAINSRWEQTKNYWITPLTYYSIFLFLFSYLSDIFLRRKSERYFFENKLLVGVFYYIGLYLLIIRLMQMKNYKNKYFILFNLFDLLSIISGITTFSLIIFNLIHHGELMVSATSMTALILWIEMLLCLRLFSGIGINIFTFRNILGKILPFFAFILVLIIGVGHFMFILFGYPALFDLQPSTTTYRINGTGNSTLTNESLTVAHTNQNKDFDTLWDAILSVFYLNTIDWNDYNYLPLILTFEASVILVFVLLIMIIALINDIFNKAREEGKLELLKFRAELINDYERIDNPFFNKSLLGNSSHICFYQDPDLTKKWFMKSQKLRDIKLYSWFKNENIIKEHDNNNFKSWYEILTGNNVQDSSELWF